MPDEVTRIRFSTKAPAVVSPDVAVAFPDAGVADGPALPDVSGYPIARRLHLGRWTAVAIICVLLALLARA